jgi:hypothetical protein
MFKELIVSKRGRGIGATLTAASLFMGCVGEVDAPTPAATPPALSEAARAEATKLTANYRNVTVEKDQQGATVEFDSPAGHQRFAFEFGANLEGIEPMDKAPAETLPDGVVAYTSEWHWWGVKYRLNRGETRDLVTEGNNAAILYAIGAAFGCGACAVGAAIEANWSGAANRFYNEGNCIHLNLPYMTTGRTNRGTHNCR